MPLKRKSGSEDETKSNLTTSAQKWALNDRVLCKYPNSDIYYEAKIIGISEHADENIFAVHYQGWNSRHDEKISETEAIERFKQYTDEDAERARDIVKKAQQERRKRKSGFTPTVDSKGGKSGDNSSRASTPSVRSLQMDARRSRGHSSTGGDAVIDGARERNIKKIILPNALRKILTDDHNLINNQHMLPKMPARNSVEQIVQQYRKSLSDLKFREAADRDFFMEFTDYSDDYIINPSAETCDQSALGLLDYFDMTVGSLLLYKFEKPMFSDLHAKEVEKLDSKNKDGSRASKGTVIRYSKHFGLVHFLRLFTRFTETLAFTQWSIRAIDAIVRHAQDFVIFLSKRYVDFYDIEQDYVVAPPEYLKRVWGGPNQ